MSIQAVNYSQFEQIRLAAKQRQTQKAEHSDWKALIEEKKKEIFSDSPQISRKNKIEVPNFKGLIQSVGSLANHYVNSKVSGTDSNLAPKAKPHPAKALLAGNFW